jgi:hypothetical protein
MTTEQYLCVKCKEEKEEKEFSDSWIRRNSKICKTCMNTYSRESKRRRGAVPRKKITTKDIVDRAKSVYGNLCSYEKVEYTGSRNKVTITCKNHGDFEVRPDAMSKKGCKKCAFETISTCQPKTTEEFISESKLLYGDIFLYHNTEYKGSQKHITIVCKKHGDFKVIAGNHFRKTKTPSGGCPECRKHNKIEDKEWKSRLEKHSKEVFGGKYRYASLENVTIKSKIQILCKEHGEFWQKVSDHFHGFHGCPTCGNQVKRFEVLTIEFLKENNIEFIYQYHVKTKKTNRFVDFYIPSRDIFLEIDEKHHFNQTKEDREREYEIEESVNFIPIFIRVPALKENGFKKTLSKAIGL